MSHPTNIVRAEPGIRYHFIEVDLLNGTARASDKQYRPDEAKPADVHHGLVRRLRVPELNYRQANRVLDAIAGDVEIIGDNTERGHFESFNGNITPTAELGPKAAVALEQLAQLLEKMCAIAERARERLGDEATDHERDSAQRHNVNHFTLNL